MTSEIMLLLESGFADGAMARWRTLHEIDIVAILIATHGDDLAKRYLAHEICESKRASDVYNSVYAELGYAKPKRTAVLAVERRHKAAIAEYGKEFATEYGWAAKVVKNSRPTFAQLEEAAGKANMRAHYKIASHNVHAGIKGITFRLGQIGDELQINTGPSYAGLDEPGQNTAITLVRLTSLLIKAKGLDDVVSLSILQSLQAGAVNAFVQAGRRLKREFTLASEISSAIDRYAQQR